MQEPIPFFSAGLASALVLLLFWSSRESGRTDADWLRELRTHVLKEEGFLFLPTLLAFWIPAAFPLLLVPFFRFGRHCLSFGLAFFDVLLFCFVLDTNSLAFLGLIGFAFISMLLLPLLCAWPAFVFV